MTHRMNVLSDEFKRTKVIFFKSLRGYNKSVKNTPKAKIEITIDVVIFSILEGRLHVLLGKRILEPFKGQWSLPGGFLWQGETTIEAARRVLEKKTNVEIENVYLEQLYTFDRPNRDPRSQIITVAYFALVLPELIGEENSSEYEMKLFPISDIPKLAFDHNEIVRYAIKRLRAKLEYTNIAYSLLPTKFTLTNLQKVYEVILGEKQDKRNFRRKYANLDLLEETKAMSTGAHRPAKLYRFKKKEPIEMPEKIF